MRGAVLAAALLACAACSGQPDEAATDDPSQLSEELEARAKEIEERADEAVREVEAEAEEQIAAETESKEAEEAKDADEAAESTR